MLAGSVSLLACIGRPVVGERAPGATGEEGVCDDDGLNCHDWGPPEAFAEIPSDAFTHAPPEDSGCDGEALEMRLEAIDTVPGIEVPCGGLRVTVAHDADVVLLSPRIDRGRIAIASEGNARVTVEGARGNGAAIALEGASTVRLRALERVQDLRIDGAGDGPGWEIEIENSSLTGLAVRTSKGAGVLLRGTRVEGARLSAGRVSLQGAVVDDSLLDTEELIAGGTQVTGGQLRARRGSFIGGTLTAASLHGCDSFVVEDAKIERSDVGACAAGPLEMGTTTVKESILRGRVFAIASLMSECILGAEEDAALWLLDTMVAWSLMCDVASLSARGASRLTCARCDPSPAAACVDSGSVANVVHCPEVATAPTCDEPLPPFGRAASPGDPPNPDAGGVP
jgi:hypothetical protein